MRIQVLATGSTKQERLIKRWGVSFLIDDDIVFDTFGDPAILIENMRNMHVNAQKIKHIVLSHDHWDHTGGLQRVLSLCNKPRVYIHKGFTESIKRTIEAGKAELITVDNVTEIKKNIFVTGPILGYYNTKPLFEQALVCKQDASLSVITGCAHPGILYITEYAAQYFSQPVGLIFGGLHLKDFSPAGIEKIITAVKSQGTKKVAPTHCTGEVATRLLQERFKENFVKVEEGKEYFFNRL